MLRFSGEGGVRRGEIVGLHWPDVDLAKRQVRIRYSYDEATKGRRARTIFISADFAKDLDAWFAESVIEGGADAKGYVWPGRSGGMMGEGSATQACRRAMIRAGLVDDDGEPLVTLHGLRHTCASIMLSKNVPLIVVSRHLGHSNANITARIYAHLIDDEQLRAVADAFEPPAVPSGTLGDALGDHPDGA